MKFTLKLIADLCFYLTFATFVLSELQRFVAVPTFVLFIPAAAYVLYAIATHSKFAVDVYYRTVFALYLKIFGAYSVFIAIYTYYTIVRNLHLPLLLEYYQRTSLPLALLFFVSATSLMRLARHDDKVQKQMAGKLVSSGPIIALVAVTVLISLAWATGIFRILGSTLYFSVFIPIILLIFRVLAILFNPFYNWMETINLAQPLEEEEYCDGCCEFAAGGGYHGLQITADEPISLFVFVIIALVVIVAFLLFLLFKMLANKALTVFDEDGVAQERIPMDNTANRRGKQKNKLRKAYIKFLAKCQKHGIQKEGHLTSEDYRRLAANKFGMENDLQKLRDIYLPVRYNDADVRAEDVSFAKKLVSKLRVPKK